MLQSCNPTKFSTWGGERAQVKRDKLQLMERDGPCWQQVNWAGWSLLHNLSVVIHVHPPSASPSISTKTYRLPQLTKPNPTQHARQNINRTQTHLTNKTAETQKTKLLQKEQQQCYPNQTPKPYLQTHTSQPSGKTSPPQKYKETVFQNR